MIRISLGALGSGKTACEVREIYLNKSGRKTYSNIRTKIKHQVDISSGMIIKKEIVDYKKNKKTGEDTPVMEYRLNKEFWQGIKEPINVVIDEAHSVINARRSMHKINIIATDWMALLRRILGQAKSGYGELVLISQLWNRIDSIARDMASQVRYHICHYSKTCENCGYTWKESSEVPEPCWSCPVCMSKSLLKHRHYIEVMHFSSMKAYLAWDMYRENSYYKHYNVLDIEQYFPLYDTLQWDNMFTEFY